MLLAYAICIHCIPNNYTMLLPYPIGSILGLCSFVPLPFALGTHIINDLIQQLAIGLL